MEQLQKQDPTLNDPKYGKTRRYKCPCGKTYLSYPALFTHIKVKHDGKPPGEIQKPNVPKGRPAVKKQNLQYYNKQIVKDLCTQVGRIQQQDLTKIDQLYKNLCSKIFSQKELNQSKKDFKKMRSNNKSCEDIFNQLREEVANQVQKESNIYKRISILLQIWKTFNEKKADDTEPVYDAKRLNDLVLDQIPTYIETHFLKKIQFLHSDHTTRIINLIHHWCLDRKYTDLKIFTHKNWQSQQQ